MYIFHLHCNTHDIPDIDKERDYSAPGNDSGE